MFLNFVLSHLSDSNRGPTVYKTVVPIYQGSEPAVRFELTTYCLQNSCSTTELCRLQTLVVNRGSSLVRIGTLPLSYFGSNGASLTTPAYCHQPPDLLSSVPLLYKVSLQDDCRLA